MWLEGKAALHVVDTQTNFGSAAFLRGQTVEHVWESFIECWSSIYTGFPEIMKVDQGSAFKSVRWKRLCEEVGTVTQESGVESHNSLGSGERYHEPLRRIFRKIKRETPRINNNVALRISIKAMNDTLGPEGLVPSLLVFGCVPRFPCINSKQPNQKERMVALNAARQEMAEITAELRIKKALSTRIPRNSDLILTKGDMVRVYRETDRKYVGPYPVSHVDDKQVFVIINEKETKFSVHQVIRADDFENMINGSYRISELSELLKQFVSRPTKTNEEPLSVHMTELLHPSDSRGQSPEAQQAKELEIINIVNRGTWTLVLEEDIPQDANVMTGGFVVTIKDVETNSPIFKARYVIHGNKDLEKDELVHNSSTLRQYSMRMIITLCDIFGFKIWTPDISQTYLQSAFQLIREIYLKPSNDLRKYIEIPLGHLLKLLRPLYGLADSGDYWNFTLSDHIKMI